MGILRSSAVFILFAVGLLSATLDQSVLADGRKVALVVGNADYQIVGRLPNPGNDALLVAQTLARLGFTIIGNGPQLNMSKAHFDQAVQDFGKAILGADTALFYYSGHGLQVDGTNWLVPVDANPNRQRDLNFQMVSTAFVLRQMELAETHLNILILDACRNNPFLSISGGATVGRADRMRVSREGTGGLARALGVGGLAPMQAPEGTLIAYATQPGNVALDGDGANSPYTAALVDAIQQPGLDVFRVFNRVGLAVKETTSGMQQPWLASSPISGRFFFNGSVPAPASVTSVTKAFGGSWSVFMECPASGAARGFTRRFMAQISNGVLHGSDGFPDQPSFLSIDGTLNTDGTTLIDVTGVTGDPAYTAGSPEQGMLYFSKVLAKFDGPQGSGKRLDVRPCTYTFTRL